MPPRAIPPTSHHQTQPFDFGEARDNHAWPTSSTAAPSGVELSRPNDIPFDSISHNSSTASWDLGLEPRFFPQQPIHSSSGYLNLPLEHAPIPQQWLVDTANDMVDIEFSKVAQDGIYSSSSSYGLRDSGSRYLASESRTTSSPHSDTERSVEYQDQPKSVPTTAPTTPAGSIEGKDFLLPPLPHTLELLDIFFTQYHHFLPCIHKKTFVERMRRQRELGHPQTPLLWILLAVAAPDHPSPHIRMHEETWMNRARTLFDEDLASLSFPTQLIQAAVWILFKSFILAAFTDAWLFLSKACRLASLLGFDCIDSSGARTFRPTVTGPRDATEIEEQRKTIWALFFFDRALSCLAGLPLAIDDRHFQVNFPYDDKFFQAESFAVSTSS